ncbi:hypothetical protein Scep_025701 [Stephania cephalantha]|uniref:Alcohol dehydrogenase-like C-terminal domain-containing protein n=1 Tax=Stephania cephalantha TaxID=152367 RepID=A0AAP0ENY5_9MAGN
MTKLEKGEETDQKAFGWAARDSSGILSPFNFTRRSLGKGDMKEGREKGRVKQEEEKKKKREQKKGRRGWRGGGPATKVTVETTMETANGENDVTIKILYCGICHTDLHTARSEFGPTLYPLVPGCNKGLENYCPELINTYTIFSTAKTITYGGFSDIIVVDERFAVRFPENLPLAGGAPLLCAGITVYSPLKLFGLGEIGKHVGVVGLGGVGHVAVKFAKAFGAKVTVISTSKSKEREAIEKLGADLFVLSHDTEQMQTMSGTMDGIIDTVSPAHSILPLINLLSPHGKLVMLGASGGKSIAGSLSGGLKETQDMIDFAAEHNITADVEVIPMDYVNVAMDRLAKGDIRYRFVIDVGNSLCT